VKVYLETGEKKSFATAIDWIGLARGGKTPDDAMAALVEYTSRYLESMGAAAAALKAPATVAGLNIVERLPGNKTTDFGAPDAILPADRKPLSQRDLDAAIESLHAAWAAFATAAKARRWQGSRAIGPARWRPIARQDDCPCARGAGRLHIRGRREVEGWGVMVGDPARLHRCAALA
jgi:hypothetical protein